MSNIVVCGLVNMETTASVDSFPIEYRPVDYRFFGISSAPAGVGLNVSLALSSLGDNVTLCSLCGDDPAAFFIKEHLKQSGVDTSKILCKNKSTAQSVILYDKSGKRYVISDLTDNQEMTYDEDAFRASLENCHIACLCNINYAAPLLNIAKEKNVKIATDVHCLSDIHDEYNSRFMRAADILFLSNENFIGREWEFICDLAAEYDNEIIVVGMGENGAMLYVRGEGKPTLIPAVFTRPVINTVGAGDSLYSAFVHFYAETQDPYLSLQRAVYFASYKIGESGASKGFLTERELLELMKESGENNG